MTTKNPKTSSTRERVILIVEDEPLILWSLQQGLLASGYCVLVAESAEEAEPILRREHIDIVVSDLKLPGRDGFSLIPAVKQHNPDSRIILMSAYLTDEYKKQAKSLGIKHILEKPVSVSDLQPLLSQA